MERAASFSSLYFDPAMRRLVPIEDIVAQSGQKLRECAETTGARLRDLEELHATLKDMHSILVLRERDVIRQIRDECQSLVNTLRRREEELIEVVEGDCSQQRDVLEGTLSRVEEQCAAMRQCVAHLTDTQQPPAERLGAVTTSEELLKQSCYFNIPQSIAYSVTSRPITAEAHLSVSRSKVATPNIVPVALTVSMPEPVVSLPPPPSASLAAAPARGIIHYIATGGGTRAFQNPAHANALTISCNCGVADGSLEQLVDAPDAEPASFRTKSQPNARIVLDFGTSRSVHVTHYVFRHGHRDEHACLRGWKLLGSVDGIRWDVLDTRSNARNIALSPFQANLFACGGVTNDADVVLERESAALSNSEEAEDASTDVLRRFYRFVAFAIDGPNAAGKGMFHIEISRLELYGALRSIGSSAAS